MEEFPNLVIFHVDTILTLVAALGFMFVGVVFLLKYMFSMTNAWTLHSYGWANIFMGMPFTLSIYAVTTSLPQGVAWISNAFNTLGYLFVLATFLMVTYPCKLHYSEQGCSACTIKIGIGPHASICVMRIVRVALFLVIGSMLVITAMSLIQYSAMISLPVSVSSGYAPVMLLPFWATVIYCTISATASFLAGYLGLNALYSIRFIYKTSISFCLLGIHDILRIIQTWPDLSRDISAFLMQLQIILIITAHLIYFETMLPETLIYARSLVRIALRR